MTAVKYLKTILPQEKTGQLNNYNCQKLAPFRYHQGVLYLTKNESARIAGTIVEEILEREFPQIVVTMQEELDQYPLLTNADEAYQKVYLANLEMTKARAWWQLLPHTQFLPLSEEQIAELLDYKFDRILGPLQKCMDLVALSLPESANNYFVKAEVCSTKHNLPPRPVMNAEDALSNLLSSDNVKHSFQTGRSKGILVQPWKTEIGPNTEFRVFVKRGVVTGVSQQFMYEIWPIMGYWEAEDVIKSFQRLYDSWEQLLPSKIKYRDCCFDGYLVTSDLEDLEARLIEINSGALGWGPAGAGMWCWETDPPPEPDSGIRELRITGIH